MRDAREETIQIGLDVLSNQHPLTTDDILGALQALQAMNDQRTAERDAALAEVERLRAASPGGVRETYYRAGFEAGYAEGYETGEENGKEAGAEQAEEACDEERQAVLAEIERLRAALTQAGAQMAFMASVIKCGEPWTETLERTYRDTFDAIREASVTPFTTQEARDASA